MPELVLAVVVLAALIIAAIRTQVRSRRKVLVIIAVVWGLIAVNMFALRLDTLYYPDRVEYQFKALLNGKYDVLKMDQVEEVGIFNQDSSDVDLGSNGLTYAPMHPSTPDDRICFICKDGRYLVLATQQADSLYEHVGKYYPFTED